MTEHPELDDAQAEWAGLSLHVEQRGHVERSEANDLVEYFRDCAVASQRALALRNAFEATDAQCITTQVDAWSLVIDEGLALPGKAALDLAMANRVHPFEKPLVIGALFIVGRYAPGPGRPRAYCAPLLVGSVSPQI